MSNIPIIFWKVSFGKRNMFGHQETRMGNAKGLAEKNICGAKWKHNITLGEFMVFFGILLQMRLFPLPYHSYVMYWAYGAVVYPFINGLFKKSEVYSASTKSK
jgi:hypothetical protein